MSASPALTPEQFRAENERRMDEFYIQRAANAGRFWTMRHEACLTRVTHLPFLAYAGNNILVEHDEVCALAVVIHACARAQDGLIPLSEMIRVIGSVSMDYLETGREPTLFSAIPRAAAKRCPYSVKADRVLDEDEVRDLVEAQGWPGEYIVLQTLGGRRGLRGWVHFSDPRAAIVARMMLSGGEG